MSLLVLIRKKECITSLHTQQAKPFTIERESDFKSHLYRLISREESDVTVWMVLSFVDAVVVAAVDFVNVVV